MRICGLLNHYQTLRMRWLGYMESRIGDFPVQVNTENRGFWVDTYFNAWEPETLEFYRVNIKPGARVCDIGAWIGPTAIFAARLGAQVVCFEPDPVAYERLLFNVRMNVPGEVRSHQVALGAETGGRIMRPMADHLGQSDTSFYSSAAEKDAFTAICLGWNDALRILEQPLFDFIKIDIEGGEAELLPVMLDYISRQRPCIQLATHWDFIPKGKQIALADAIGRLLEIYPSATVDWDAIRNGFPCLRFVP